MKRTFKIGLIVVLVGLVMIVAGWFGHGFKDVTYDSHRRPQLVETKTTDHKVDAFDSVKVDLKSCQLRIKEGSSYRVQVRAVKGSMPAVSTNGKQLIINQKHAENAITGWSFGNRNGGFFGFGNMNDESKLPNRTVVITVPRGTKLKQVDLTNRDGNMRLTGVKIEQLSIKTMSGVSLENLDTIKQLSASASDSPFNVRKTTLEQPSITAGSVSLTESNVHKGNIKVTDGDFTMQNSTFTDLVSVINDEGNNNVTGADANKGYELHGDEANNLFDQHNDEGLLQRNEGAADQLHMTATDGSNSVK